MIFKYPLVILESHLDTFGHVNNAKYLELLESARWDLITGNGYGMEMIKKSGLGPTIVEIQMKFLKELRLRQKVIIETELVSYERKIGVLRQDIVDEKGEVYFQGKMVFGLFDTKERKLVLPTPEWLKALGLEAKTESSEQKQN